MQPLNIKGTFVPFSNEAKYLGIMLDSKLTWNSHLKYVTGKATTNLWTMKQLASNYYGLKPKMAKYLYNQTVVPCITYGALVWWGKVNQNTAKLALRKIQRMALIAITGAIRTTPTAALEMITGIKPLNVIIKERAMEQAVCLTNAFKYKEGDLKGHLNILKIIKPLFDMTKLTNMCPIVLKADMNFNVAIPSRDDWVNNPWIADNHSQKWFTDGSKTDHGTGAGIYGPGTEISLPLHSSCSIFEAELAAIQETGNILVNQNITDNTISIFSDSQAVLKALKKKEISSKSVLKCWETLNGLGAQNSVNLVWVPGHEGHEGNEAADVLAKSGGSTPFHGPGPGNGFSKNDLKTLIEQWGTNQTSLYWIHTESLEHSKRFLSWDPKLAHNNINLTRKNLSILCGAKTGHSPCNYHLKKIGVIDTPNCRFCHLVEEKTIHIIAECPALANKRYKLFSKHFLEVSDYRRLSTKGLVEILRGIYE